MGRKHATVFLSPVIPVILLAIAACSSDPPRRPEPAVAMRAPAARPSPAVVQASPGLAVSRDIVAQCKLEFGAVERAPKFEFDRSDLLPEDRDVLQRVASCITSGPLKGRALRLVGHTDPRGEVEYNLSLGGRRAGSARDYLTHLGVEPGRVGETSRGELDASGKDEGGWSRDRRVDILLQ